MKKYLIPVLFVAVSGLISCGNNGKPTVTDSMNQPADSVKDGQMTQNDTNILENLLAYNSEKALIEKFGKSRIKYDTVWGAEGMFDMGSYLDEGTPNQVQFTWTDSAGRSGIGGIMVTLPYNPDGPRKGSCIWHSKTGVKLGMSVADVQAINGHQFKFSGIGWDYGGAITDWEKGKLDNAGVTVMLDADYNVHSNEKDYNAVSGEQDVMSDDPAVKAVGMQVVQLFVYNPPK